MSITESLGIDHIMATPGRARVTRGVPLPAIPEKKKRGPKPGSKHKKKVSASGAVGDDLGMSAVGMNDVRVDGLSPQEVLNHRFTRMLDVLVAEYQHQQELRDAAQARMTYLDGLYNQMTDGEFSLQHSGTRL